MQRRGGLAQGWLAEPAGRKNKTKIFDDDDNDDDDDDDDDNDEDDNDEDDNDDYDNDDDKDDDNDKNSTIPSPGPA